MSKAPAEIVKVTTNLPRSMIGELAENATRTGKTLTRALGEAITTKNFLSRELRAGAKVLIEDPDGTLWQVQIP